MLRYIETKVDGKIQVTLRTFHTRPYYFTKIIACAVTVYILVGHDHLQKCVAVFFFTIFHTYNKKFDIRACRDLP
jgi:hypothetical protein